MKRESLPPGIRRRPGRPGYSAHVRIKPGPGGLPSKHFPEGTAPSVMVAWQEKQRTKAPTPPPAGTLAAAMAEYLTRITAKVTYTQIVAHLKLWAHELGRDRSPASVTAIEVDQVMQRWLVTPAAPPPGSPGRPTPHGTGTGTVRRRKTSLQSFYKFLNGKHGGHNPARDAQSTPAPKKAEARALDMAVLLRIIAAMPTYRRKRHGHARELSLAKIRMGVIAATGIPPGILGKIEPRDLNLEAGTVRVACRLKGGGVEARTIELTVPGVAAFRAFHEAKAYGWFSSNAVNQCFKKAAKRIGMDPRSVCTYLARHTFLTHYALSGAGEGTIARAALHAPGSRMTARYTMAAHAAIDRAAAARFTVPELPVAAPVVEPESRRERAARLRAERGRLANLAGLKLAKQVGQNS